MWSEIIQYIQELQQNAKKNGSPLWFRGQSNANWTLLSSMHRYVNDAIAKVRDVPQKLSDEKGKIALMREAYKTLFHKFKARAIQLLPAHERSDWGLIFAMQHLGLPTRLLDWTESFPCAVYFAQRDRNPSDDAAIFVFAPELHNQKIVGNSGVVFLGGNADKASIVKTHQYHPAVVCNADDMETPAVQPELTNARMVAQRSAFTLCGASFQPLEERYPESVRKLLLPSSDFREAQDFLQLSGQSHFGLFPDLEGLRLHLLEAMKEEVDLAQED
jgi:hypothetical protein